MLFPFPGSPPKPPYPITPSPASMRVLPPTPTHTHPHPPTPTSPLWHSPTLGCQTPSGPRASPPIDVWQGLPLPHMQPEPWVPSGVLFGWWFSPSELWPGRAVRLVDALPMGLQTPSTSSVLSLTPPLQSPCSVRWLAASIHICICQTLAEPLRGQPYQAPTSKSFLALAIVSMFGVYRWDESPDGAVSG
jgi:hypothetical protein